MGNAIIPGLIPIKMAIAATIHPDSPQQFKPFLEVV
jgi:hypothetical protein